MKKVVKVTYRAQLLVGSKPGQRIMMGPAVDALRDRVLGAMGSYIEEEGWFQEKFGSANVEDVEVLRQDANVQEVEL